VFLIYQFVFLLMLSDGNVIDLCMGDSDIHSGRGGIQGDTHKDNNDTTLDDDT